MNYDFKDHFYVSDMFCDFSIFRPFDLVSSTFTKICTYVTTSPPLDIILES